MQDASTRHPLGIWSLASLCLHMLVRERESKTGEERDSSGKHGIYTFISDSHESCSWCDCYPSVSSSRPHVVLFNGTKMFVSWWPFLSKAKQPPWAPPDPQSSLSRNLLSQTVALFILLFRTLCLQCLSPLIYIRLVVEVKVNTANTIEYMNKYLYIAVFGTKPQAINNRCDIHVMYRIPPSCGFSPAMINCLNLMIGALLST